MGLAICPETRQRIGGKGRFGRAVVDFDEVRRRVGQVPFIRPENARYLHDLIVEQELESILELGIAHGTATCFMAAALRALGRGRVTAVDLEEPFDPAPEDQVAACGFADLVEFHRMKTGYNWFLHDAIRAATRDDICTPVYDLCIIDGPKNWTIDSSAFFLVDKLLRPGGWLIFDDYGWTYAGADAKRDATDGISHRALSEDERRTPHIREIFELLVKQHPDYGHFTIRGDWAIARKRPAEPKLYTIDHDWTARGLLGRAVRPLARGVARMRRR